MYSIDDNNITITRGDSAAFRVTLSETVTGSMSFVLMNGNDVLVTRIIKDNKLFIRTEDTQKLAYGTYTYNLYVGREKIIANKKFIVQKEVTF